MQEKDLRSPIERRVQESFEDDSGHGKPLSRRARQTKRTLESYLAAGGLPRYMERLREIDGEVRRQTQQLDRAYRAIAESCRGDGELFARLWRAKAHEWRFEKLNDLIREHNEYYPIEARLPLDPRTGDYVRRAGRSYRREPLGPDWVLEHFPADARSIAA